MRELVKMLVDAELHVSADVDVRGQILFDKLFADNVPKERVAAHTCYSGRVRCTYKQIPFRADRKLFSLRVRFITGICT